ncbi:MAG: ribosomal protein S18-alanine N-acetyltransferase [Gammaproteobacteria bacterium]|nr:ribosomal protein S18-alanine N-acetyltransferase [Gammaproteobacteria bacterium]MCP5135867.1 ribosomal protein S18-alanine N-acetyltransferase [Gammaproteobacteria bacterium]
MTLDDLPAVMRVEQSSYPYPWTENIFRDCLRVGYSCWICAEAGNVLGYIVMSVAVGEAHILNVCVNPAQRRTGLGRRLLASMLRLAGERGADTMLLEVRPSNIAAVSLYEDMGFNEVGRRKNYYPSAHGKEDALIFAKAI